MSLESHITTIADFPKPGIVFRDVMPLLRNPRAFAEVLEDLRAPWIGKIDCVAAPESRGFLFGVPLALALGVSFVPVRKAGKLPGPTVKLDYDLEYGSDSLEVQVGAIASGARVLLVDDLLATGGTALAACNLVKSVGGEVVGCAFVIELADLHGRMKLSGFEVRSLVTY